jgi:hypothetical protein
MWIAHHQAELIQKWRVGSDNPYVGNLGCNAARRIRFGPAATIFIFSTLRNLHATECRNPAVLETMVIFAASIAAVRMFEGWRGAVVASSISTSSIRSNRIGIRFLPGQLLVNAGTDI